MELDHVSIKGNLNLSYARLCSVYFNNSINYGTYNFTAMDENGFPYYRGSTEDVTYFGPISCIRYCRDKSRLVSSPITICNSTIEGDVDFSNTVFLSPINFKNTQIKGNITFDDERCSYMQSIFNGPVDFTHCQIDGIASFDGSYFNESAIFEKSKFNGSAIFGDSIFKRSALFSHSRFEQYGIFSDSDFHQGASFAGSQFMRDTYFDDSRFRKYTDFSNTKFNHTTAFGSCNFVEKVDFSNAIFNNSVYFIDANFEDDVRFWSSYFRKPSYFTGSKFSKDVDLSGSQFNQGVGFKLVQFNGSLDSGDTTFLGFINLTKVKFSILDMNFPENILLICNDGPTYLKLIKNFRDLERYEMADTIYYEYRDWRQRERSWSDGAKYLDILAWFTCGYGVRIDYTIKLSIIILILFSIAYFVISQHKKLSNAKSSERLIESFLFSLIILISAPKELYPLKNKTYEDYAEHIKYLPILERIIGWGLLLLFINTLSRVMIRY